MTLRPSEKSGMWLSAYGFGWGLVDIMLTEAGKFPAWPWIHDTMLVAGGLSIGAAIIVVAAVRERKRLSDLFGVDLWSKN